ncbi:pyruvate formate lyase activating enzyme [Caldanaerobius fijiensis DSM 17918]|uniref:Pyruvate formate lyase activating enzyme n=1 Tax=Caldanaerobius fijiensis DSM 17918 TaxID=1121256 RepID=A0A1M5F864_9THEO|nr:radical SAM protein [Caldanaerobius fijiensis]SHF87666.1 pyruvate formate lyase activating enzyme [Caldanaerobius fijiensis DSM 17918]
MVKVLGNLDEIRPAYFLKAFGKEVKNMRIFSFGLCNFLCPYCKRMNNAIAGAKNVSENELFAKIDEALKNEEVVRLSGGDPSMYPKLSVELLEYAKNKNGITSIAHNGSNVKYIEKVMPYLDFAAIDVKGSTPEKFAKRTGISIETAEKMLKNALAIQDMLADAGILVDIRTCVFSDDTKDDLIKLADMIFYRGTKNKFWTVRLYQPVEGCSWEPLPYDVTINYLQEIKENNKDIKLGVRTNWKGGFIFL